MSLTTDTAAGKAGAAESTDVVIVNLRPMWIAAGVLVTFYPFIRIYEQIYGWRAGFDFFAPEFQTVLADIALDRNSVGAGRGPRSGRLPLEDAHTRHVSVEHARGIAPLGSSGAMAGRLRHRDLFRCELLHGADATWHMTVIRDTDFTPSHILEFE